MESRCRFNQNDEMFFTNFKKLVWDKKKIFNKKLVVEMIG